MNNLLTEPEAARFLNMSRSFLRQARMKGTGPKFLKIGRAVRYTLEDLQAWLDSKTAQNTVYLARA